MPVTGIKSVWENGNLSFQTNAGASVLTLKSDGTVSFGGNITVTGHTTMTGNLTVNGNQVLLPNIPTAFNGNGILWRDGNATKVRA
jgi:hypothetical protein